MITTVHSTHGEERRLTAQCEAILARLKTGRMTNREMSAIACQYNGRIYDLRKAGYDVRLVERDRTTGVSWYELKQASPEPLQTGLF